MSEKQKNKYHVQGISFESLDLLNEAKKRAKSFGLSFSRYMINLAKNDIEDGRSDIIRYRPNESQTYPALKTGQHMEYNDRAGAPPSPPAKPEDIAAEKLGQRAVNDLPGSPVKPAAPEPSPAAPEGKRMHRKVVGIVRRAAAGKAARQEKRAK